MKKKCVHCLKSTYDSAQQVLPDWPSSTDSLVIIGIYMLLRILGFQSKNGTTQENYNKYKNRVHYLYLLTWLPVLSSALKCVN